MLDLLLDFRTATAKISGPGGESGKKGKERLVEKGRDILVAKRYHSDVEASTAVAFHVRCRVACGTTANKYSAAAATNLVSRIYGVGVLDFYPGFWRVCDLCFFCFALPILNVSHSASTRDSGTRRSPPSLSPSFDLCLSLLRVGDRLKKSLTTPC